MGETSRAIDKKLLVNNKSKKKKAILNEYSPYFVYGSGDKIDVHTKKPLGITGCVANGIDPSVAELIWKKMSSFGEYAFNKSHGGAYAVNSIRTAWCACHYPEIFRKSILNVFIDKPDKMKVYLADISNKKINLLPPSVNNSKKNFSMEDPHTIRFALGGIKGVKNLAREIEAEVSERGEFVSYRDFVERMIKFRKCNKAAFENLIYAGALDEFEGTRKAKLLVLEEIINNLKLYMDVQVKGQKTVFDLAPSLSMYKEIEIPEVEEFDQNTKFFKEEEVAKVFISGHPLDKYKKEIEAYRLVDIFKLMEDEKELNPFINAEVSIAGVIDELERKIDKNGDSYYVFTLKDRTSEIRCTAFKGAVKDLADISILTEKQIVAIHGVLKEDDFGRQFIVKGKDAIAPLAELFSRVTEVTCKLADDLDEAKKQVTEISKMIAFDDSMEDVKNASIILVYHKARKEDPKNKIPYSYGKYCELMKLLGNLNVKNQLVFD